MKDIGRFEDVCEYCEGTGKTNKMSLRNNDNAVLAMREHIRKLELEIASLQAFMGSDALAYYNHVNNYYPNR